MSQIIAFERIVGFELPDDFIEFYLLCNGFSCTDGGFSMSSLKDILAYENAYGYGWFHFSEYMTFCDMWSLKKTESGLFEILNRAENEVVLTTSLLEFLSRFSEGNVYDARGLNEWRIEVQSSNLLPPHAA